MSDDIDSKCPPECGPGCWNNENNPNQCKTGPNANKENCERRKGTWCADHNTEERIREKADRIKVERLYNKSLVENNEYQIES